MRLPSLPDSSNKHVDKMPLIKTPSIDENDDRKMDATDSKIHVNGSIVDGDNLSLDGEDPIQDLKCRFE